MYRSLIAHNLYYVKLDFGATLQFLTQNNDFEVFTCTILQLMLTVFCLTYIQE